MDKSLIKKVHVVFKTHLDIGFTDLGQTVLNRYVEEYIPHSIDLAFALNTEKDKKFIWTVGSYLIDYYFSHADSSQCEKLEKAIRRGDICWHGLAFTTHTELLDKDLMDFNLSISDKLDKQFGKKTIAAKMTDVPGHTKAMVAHLSKHGKEYLHLGVNPSSMVPQVPKTFVWKFNDHEVIVQYSFTYGDPCYAAEMDEILEFAHTGDNLGPQSEEAIQTEMDRIQAEYPNAQVFASTMDAYAKTLLTYKEKLPVIEEEIGDTWIHGIASDPLKIARYKAFIQLKNKWLSNGILKVTKDYYKDFMMNLMLIAEHTWGLDYKKYLADFTNWEKADFQAARLADTTTLDFLTNRNANMLTVLEDDFKKYRNGTFTGSYKQYEYSHAEQMEYINIALNSLPKKLKQEAENELNRLDSMCKPPKESNSSFTFHPFQHIKIGFYEVAFGGSGEIVFLAKDGVKWITDGCFGRLVYSTYNASDCVNQYYSYNRAFRQNQCWSEGDFSKPGLEFAETLEHREYLFGAAQISICGSKATIYLEGNAQAAELYGCPVNAYISYTFEDNITCSLSWNQKDANRMPEALWFDMNFDVENPYRWKMEKLGQLISPLDVVKGGNRRQHCTEEMVYSGSDGSISIKNIHSPLISVGGRWLYGDYRHLPDIGNGFSYCLFNNKWGTNFKMWCEDNCTFEYEIKIKNN